MIAEKFLDANAPRIAQYRYDTIQIRQEKIPSIATYYRTDD